MIELASNRKQLFLDDYIIERLEGVRRALHQPRKYSRYPVLQGGHRWENQSVQIRGIPQWVPPENIWKVWYIASDVLEPGEEGKGASWYAVSRDGLNWEKPFQRLYEYRGSKENNMVAESTIMGVIFDESDENSARGYKGLMLDKIKDEVGLYPVFSADGIHWSKPMKGKFIRSSDEAQVIYDELSGRFLATVKWRGPYGRSFWLSWSDDFDTWTEPELVFHADERDQELGRERIQQARADENRIFPRVDVPDKYNTDIYNFPVFPYEDIYIGMPCIFDQTGPKPEGNQAGFLYPELACSRDTYHWHRVAERQVFIPLGSREYFDSGMILAASRPIPRDDELWIYYTGLPSAHDRESRVSRFNGGVGLATLRLDGFVSLDAGDEGGSMLTKPMVIEGNRLHINADAVEGEVRAEVLRADGNVPLPGFSAAESIAVTGDHLDAELGWKGKPGISEVGGESVRIRFLLRNASLYAFWASS